MRVAWIAGSAVTAMLVVVLIALEPSAILSLSLSTLVIVLVALWTGQKNALQKAILVSIVVHLISLTLYAWQYSLLPNFIGFTGPQGGIGTDDHFFYTTGVMDLDGWFWKRKNYYISTYVFSDIIKYTLKFYYYVFGYNHPLQIIILNNIGVGLVPIFVGSLLQRLHVSESGQKLAFLLCVFDPFLLANGVILMRDGWIASMTIGCIAALLGRQWFLAILTLAIAYAMRVESVLLMVGNAAILAGVLLNSRLTPEGRRMAFYPVRFTVIAAMPFLLILPLALNPELLIEIGTKAVLGRPEFVEGFIRQASVAEGGTSTLLTIAQQPFPFRQIAGFLFFLGAPFLALNIIVVDGVFVPRALMANVFSLIFVATLPLFVRAVFYHRVWSNALWLSILLIFIADTFVLAELSMQVRHKTATIPLYYVIVALGLANKSPSVARLGLVAATTALIVNLVLTYLNLF